MVTVRDGEREIQVSKQRALIKSLVAAAIDGNQRAAASVLAICVRMLAEVEDDEAIDSVEDRDMSGGILQAHKACRGSGSKVMRHDPDLLLRNDFLSFAQKAFWEMNAQRMPEDRYLPRHLGILWIGSVCLSAWILGRDPRRKS